jgi:hypothetical protein
MSITESIKHAVGVSDEPRSQLPPCKHVTPT